MLNYTDGELLRGSSELNSSQYWLYHTGDITLSSIPPGAISI